MTRTIIVVAAGLALVAVLSAAPAQAQRDRVFVVSCGSDSTINNNDDAEIKLYGDGIDAPIDVKIAHSDLDNNTNAGIFAQALNTFVNIILKDVTVSQSKTGIALSGATTAWLSQVTASATAGAGLQHDSNSEALSDGPIISWGRPPTHRSRSGRYNDSMRLKV